MNYRKITDQEVAVLQKQGCVAEDWSKVQVSADFVSERMRDVRLSGEIRLGNFGGMAEPVPGVKVPAGIYHSALHNVSAGDGVYIEDVTLLCNYQLENDVVLQNVASLSVDGETAFGNGTELEILNEGGGRDLLIYDRLSAQLAYLIVLYRHDTDMVQRLEAMIKAYCDGKKATLGTIAEGSRIRNCATIRNVTFGPSCHIQGAVLLENGTVASTAADPSTIGDGVMAKDFIIQSGSKVESGALLDSCFVGQGVRIGKQYSAENSAFFANCEGFHGEAVSIFAGPYTVTHHKSTLMIAGLFSFYNAGSGTNQSNHMYKLGPLHQGILERGSKTGSLSYMLWPSATGPFSVVTGKHYTNFDASEFPFSYIMEEEGKSILVPAMNLFTVGTRRDSQKWPKRDRRKDPVTFDRIHFDLFNPYIIGKTVKAIAILRDLLEKTPKEREFVSYKGLQIKRLMLRSCIKFYEMAVQIYIGQCLAEQLQNAGTLKSYSDLLQKLQVSADAIGEEWIDICGLLCARESAQQLLTALASGKMDSLEVLDSALQTLFEAYTESNWAWCRELIEQRSEKGFGQLEKEDLIDLLNTWSSKLKRLNNMILNDAQKEFDPNSRIGYGIDGDEDTKKRDFAEVRGDYESNAFVTGLQEETERVEQTARNLIQMLQNLD